jgi:hypothetical protein
MTVIVRLFRLQPALLGSTAAAVYAAAAMLYRAYVAKDVAVLDWDLLVAAGTAVWGLWTYLQVTPLARPRTAKGHPMHGPMAGGNHTPATDRTPPL